jgi:hypothetical protein
MVRKFVIQKFNEFYVLILMIFSTENGSVESFGQLEFGDHSAGIQSC